MSDRDRIPQAAPAARTADLEKEFRRVKRKLQTADDRQAESLAKSRLVCRALENERLLREDAMVYGDLSRTKADVSLKPLTFAVLGQSGRGKSTLAGALIGRSDFHSNMSGKPVTACVSRTFMDIEPDAAEYAVLQMRTTPEIKALVERKVKGLGVDDFLLPTDIEDLPEALSALHTGNGEPHPTLSALRSVVDQFIRHEDLVTAPVAQRRIPLDSASGRQRLHDVIREDSTENTTPEHRIADIVKSVDIHLRRPAREDATRLELPDTCLVDTFGTGGATTHSWGLEELLYQGTLDVVLFCVNPRRVTETEFDLARMINAALRTGQLHRTQILIIHNAKDEAILHDESQTAISELMHVLSGGPERFDVHETSALAALWAVEARNGTPLPNPEKYKSMAVALGLDPEAVSDLDAPELHTAVYANSGLPELIQAINAVTRAYTVAARVKAAETAVGETLAGLSEHYEAEDERFSEALKQHGNADFKSVALLKNKEAAAYAYIGQKRSALLAPEPETLQTLQTEARETLYTALDAALPKLWDDNLVPDRLRTAPTPLLQRPLPRHFVSDIEEWVWLQLDLKPIGQYFAGRIETAFATEEACEALLLFGFNTPVAAEVMSVAAVREITRAVGTDIIDFAANAGKAMLGKPDYRLIPSDISRNNPPAVVQLLETIANTHDRNANAEHFEALLNTIRTRYDPGIEEAVAAIRGFYEAKLADIERNFGDLIFQTFITLQDHRNTETLVATLFEAVDDEVQALHQQKQTVDLKRARLKSIATLLTPTEAPDTDGSEF